MAPKLAHLRSMTDEQIVEQYDQAAQHTALGTGFYLDELPAGVPAGVRCRAREAASARRLAIVTLWSQSWP